MLLLFSYPPPLLSSLGTNLLGGDNLTISNFRFKSDPDLELGGDGP